MAAARRCARLLASFLPAPSHAGCVPHRAANLASARPTCLATVASLSERASAESQPCVPAPLGGPAARTSRHLALPPSGLTPAASRFRVESFAVADLLCAIHAPSPAFSSASQRIDSAPPQHLSADAPSATPAEGSDGARSAPLAACESGGDEEDDPILARREADRAPDRARSAPDDDPIRSDADGGGEASNAVDGGRKQRPPPESVGEHGGPSGPEPTRYGDWEKGGRCIDF
ncbi:unnamed protein product [Closterium sp. Yama58-4]|nr:unnamed protein product [Closterium sp. Yama58-4]